MGTTCSGKSTIAKRLQEAFDYGRINVGEEFRKRYPPSYFDGKGAMEKTEKETREIYSELWNKNYNKKIVIVEGQPRLQSQVNWILNHDEVAKLFISVYTDEETIKERIIQRFGDDIESIELSLQRITNDKIQLFDVYTYLANLGIAFRQLSNYQLGEASECLMNYIVTYLTLEKKISMQQSVLK